MVYQVNDVVIVGAGPNGLLMACELALAGATPLVVEQAAERPAWPKANGLIGRVVEALDRRGLYEQFSGSDAPPVPLPYFQFGALPLDMSRMHGTAVFALPIPQRRMEEILEVRALERGVQILRGYEVIGLRQTTDLVTVEAVGPQGSAEFRAQFVVGADGGHSVVRKTCGIEFPGITDSGFVGRTGQVDIPPPFAVPGTGELDVPGVGRFRSGTFTRTENGMFAYANFAPGVHRLAVYEWTPSPPGERTAIALEELREAVGRVLGADVPMTEPAPGVPAGLSRSVGSNSRQAARYREGRVFLVGDAAHVHSGVGGPGLNLGMQDVLNLGWKLAAAARGTAPEGLLDTYQDERRPVGERVIMHTRAQTALLSPGPHITALRQLFAELLSEQDNVRHIADLLAGADTVYSTGLPGAQHPLAGRWMPDLRLSVIDSHFATNGPSGVNGPFRANQSGADGPPDPNGPFGMNRLSGADGLAGSTRIAIGGGSQRVAEVMRAGRPVLLDLAGRDDLFIAAKEWVDRVDLVRATVIDPLTATRPLPDAILIRPDSHVAWACEPETPDAVESLLIALRTWFGDSDATPASRAEYSLMGRGKAG